VAQPDRSGWAVRYRRRILTLTIKITTIDFGSQAWFRMPLSPDAGRAYSRPVLLF
jgi:hypothetical protein